MTAHALLPAERFLWAVIDGALLRGVRGRVLDQRIGLLAEEVIPMPLEELHLAWIRAHRDAEAPVIVCALPTAELGVGDLLTEDAVGTVHLGPVDWPEAVRSHPRVADTGIAADPASLNLLTGPFEPRPARRWRRGAYAAAAAGLGLALATALVAMQERIEHARQVARSLQTDRLALIASLLPPSDAAGPVLNPQPPDLRLAVALRRLRPTREQHPGGVPESSASPRPDRSPAADLAALLRRWPDQEGVLAESVAIGDGAATLRISLPSNQDLVAFLDALSGDGAWSIRPPQVSATRDGVQATVRIERVSLATEAMRQTASPRTPVARGGA